MPVSALEDDGNPTLSLPPKFESIEKILEISNERLEKQPFTNVIGIVTDFQPPCETRGTDWKCAFTLRDISTQYDTGIKVHIFWPREKMPHFDGCQDMVLIRNVKIQMFHGVISLRANYATEFHQFRAADQPSWPVTSKGEFAESKSSQKGSSPNAEERRYVTWMFHKIDKDELPNAEQFAITSRNAMNTRDKFSLLKDVQGDRFYDIIVEIVRIHQSSDHLTLYVTDYTPNSQFYNHAAVAANEYNSRDGDEYGYTKSKPKTDSTWPGPFGKMAIQLTLWAASADYISEKGKQGDWIHVENVRMKYPKSGGCLEATQHSERDNPQRVRVSFMAQSEDPDANDTHWKDAVRRKRDYWKKFTEQKKAFEEETSGRGKKRPANEDASTSKKKKRRKEKEERQQLATKSHNFQAHQDSMPDNANVNPMTPSAIQHLKDGLNLNVQSFHPDIAPLSFNELFNPAVYLRRTDQGNIGALPFINRNFKVAVKVIDYFPHHLVDFSQGRTVSDYDMLSDHSGGEDSDTSSEISHPFKLDSSSGKQKKWEWRFSLLLEDQTPHRSGNIRQWVVVDNHSAQMLLEMDAIDLRKNKQEESQLRERLAILWGNLESLKWTIIRQLKNPPTNQSREPGNKTSSYEQPLIQQMIGDSMDPKSDKVIDLLNKNAKPKAALFEEVAKYSRKPKIGDMPPTSDDEGDDLTSGQPSLPISSGDTPSSTPDDPAAAYEAMLRDPKKRAIIHRLLRNESILKYYEPVNVSKIISKLLYASDKLESAPFTCGIMEYGISGKRSSEDHSEVNYKRRLKMFGTRILFPENS